MCLSLTTANTCGLHGFCDEELNKCICDEGWSKSIELIYFPFTKDKVEFNKTDIFDKLPCSLNKTLLFTFFLLSFLSSTFALLYNLPHLKTRKRIIRQSPLLLSFLFYAICSLIRVVDLDRIYADDKFFTFTVGLAVFFQNTGTCVFVSKYISYHLKKRNKAFASDLKIIGFKATPILKLTIPVFFTLDVLLLPVFVLPSFLDKKLAGYFFYTESILQAFRCLVFSLLTYSTSMGIIRDMNIVIESYREDGKKPPSFYLYCQAAIPNLEMVTYSVVGYSFAFGQANLLYSIFEFQELIQKYYFALSGFGWAAMSTIITYALVNNLKIAQKLKSTPETRKRFATSTRNPTSFTLPPSINI
eukprot:snap_masked-scaffold_42-processed-gene-1.38-mRNA-1 protein AED:1.00 eAED:1.00 QI:0/-1/0/0/-1/1/1/0/358